MCNIHSKKHNTSASGSHCNMVRLRTYSLEIIFDFIKSNPGASHYVDADGYKCKLRRAKILYQTGIDCKRCPVKGAFFALELWPDWSVHFDLYGIDEVGDEVLITIDHNLAKSKGGKNVLENYVTLCKICNELKGSS